GFFGIGDAEYRGVAKFALHHFAAGCLGIFPIVEHVTEADAILGLPAADLEGDLSEDAEAAFTTHHDLVKIRTIGSAGMRAGFEDTTGSHIFLVDNYVLDFAIVSGILPSPTGDNPATNAGKFEGLGKMPDSVIAFRPQLCDGVL